MGELIQRDYLRRLLRAVEKGDRTPEHAADVIISLINENYDLKQNTVAPSTCLHDWDEGHNGVSKCKVCGKYSA
jgi:hypothetical protein